MKEINKQDIEKSNSWPIVEAKKILKERKSFIEKKGKIVLQTGYGPSGLPHIGTFGEVARTSMVVNALNLLTDLPKEIITFSDDMDGLRKVPDNVPNKKILTDNLHKPLTVVPDPFQKFGSFEEHNNEMLKKFLDQFNFKYNFLSSTKLYKSGFFNEPLKKILENYDEIMNIIIPTLGKERQKTYSPFLPICPKTGHVLEIPVTENDKKKIIRNRAPLFGPWSVAPDTAVLRSAAPGMQLGSPRPPLAAPQRRSKKILVFFFSFFNFKLRNSKFLRFLIFS